MTKNDLVLYEDLTKFLEDICIFLKQEIRSGHMSVKTRDEANTLIHRSRKQLQAIAKTAPSSDSDSACDPYVNMQGPVVEEYVDADVKPADVQELYSDPSVDTSESELLSTAATEDGVCPYANLPAQSLSSDEDYGKRGYLYRKEKFLFIDQQKKVYVGVQDKWLLIYYNAKDTKPCQSLDLNIYRAVACDLQDKDQKKRNCNFDLISSGKHKYQFTASTSIDMFQWIEAINRHHDTHLTIRAKLPAGCQNRNLPPLPQLEMVEDDSELDHYEPLNNEVEYNEIENRSSSKEKSNGAVLLGIKQNNMAPLPPRQLLEKTCFVDKISEEEAQYDPVGNSESQNYCFSDDNDEIYNSVGTFTPYPPLHSNIDFQKSFIYFRRENKDKPIKSTDGDHKNDFKTVAGENDAIEKQRKMPLKPKILTVKQKFRITASTNTTEMENSAFIKRSNSGKVTSLIQQLTKRK